MPGWSVRGSERSPSTAKTSFHGEREIYHAEPKVVTTSVPGRHRFDGRWPDRCGMRAHGRTRAHRGSCRSDCGARRNRCARRHRRPGRGESRKGRPGARHDRRPDRLPRLRALPVSGRQPSRPRHAGAAGAAQGQEAREAGDDAAHRRDRPLDRAVPHRHGADDAAGLRGRKRHQAGSRGRGRGQPDDQDHSGRHDQSRRLRPLLDVAARQGHPVRGRRAPRFG